MKNGNSGQTEQSLENSAQLLLDGSSGYTLAPLMLPGKESLATGLLLAGRIQPVGDHEMIIFKPGRGGS